jgi:hypothetical protein
MTHKLFAQTLLWAFLNTHCESSCHCKLRKPQLTSAQPLLNDLAVTACSNIWAHLEVSQAGAAVAASSSIFTGTQATTTAMDRGQNGSWNVTQQHVTAPWQWVSPGSQPG